MTAREGEVGSGRDFTRRERELVLGRVRGGAATVTCPRCGGGCAVIRTDPRGDVAYVRRRVVVRCSRCLRSCGAEVDA